MRGVTGLKGFWCVTMCLIYAAFSRRLLNLSVKGLSRIIISCRNHGGSNCLDPSFPVVRRPVNRILLSEGEVSLAACNAGSEAASGRSERASGKSTVRNPTLNSTALCAEKCSRGDVFEKEKHLRMVGSGVRELMGKY